MADAFRWIMFLCTALVLLFNLFYMYPKKWQDRKIILGVKSRKEFNEAGVAERIEAIVKKAHRQAVIITVVGFVIAAMLLLIRGMLLQTFFWMLFLFIVIIGGMIPYILGHSALMSVKKQIGLQSSEGILLADLKVSGNVHALRPAGVILPNLVGLIPVILSLLLDLGVIHFGESRTAGSFFATIVIGTFYLMGILLAVFAVVMDRMKNEVISADSDVNANYNRAKKKNRADLSVGFIWINVIYTFSLACAFFFWYSEALILGGMLVYLLLIFADIFIFLHFDKKIEARYISQTQLVTDDDAYWIAGMFYYNPADKHLNVEKRAGVGATVNLAHPVGRIVGIIGIGLLLETVLALVWIAFLETTPISLRVEDAKVICHQLRDEYVIPVDEMDSIEYGRDIKEHTMIRISGVGMDTLLKGNFSVDGVSGCKLFLNPQNGEYIKIVTKSGTTYYVSGASDDETTSVMTALK
ncbi:MAG: DUF5808 domain-containing protein [Lachnospiraceae bacterium]|nr:DUF5808 domain-containing protein [Lachnospiraceae bacterium]